MKNLGSIAMTRAMVGMKRNYFGMELTTNCS